MDKRNLNTIGQVALGVVLGVTVEIVILEVYLKSGVEETIGPDKKYDLGNESSKKLIELIELLKKYPDSVIK